MTFVFSSYSMLLCNKPYVSKCIILGEESIRVKEVYMILACVLFLNSSNLYQNIYISHILNIEYAIPNWCHTYIVQ